ncbi:hypothetical protein IQ259_14325 [Fortiea sp. LEGE XX443]|uniref:hypothetical protein n=1 Tax=Fortiea sp. LEGE XX443 TaxID=1828611 RepID=UPI00187E38DD|nr:hypothetical protein [Fortiea sp. LEGE XX443]MBE9006199.1 hypothetical protein [Fortiea sp. LEGE XX443]
MFYKVPVQVLGCLRPGIITVIGFPGVGMVDGGNFMHIPTELIPVDLRMPNSEFIVVCDQRRDFIQVLSKDSDTI